MFWTDVGLLASTGGIAIASALLPFVNIEAVLLAAPALRERPPLFALAIAAAVGQTLGKIVYFKLGDRAFARRSTRAKKPRPRRDKLAAWSTAVLARRPIAGAAVVLASALVGLPPLLLISVAAGAAKMPLAVFAVTTLVGRFGRFLLILLGGSSLLHLLPFG